MLPPHMGIVNTIDGPAAAEWPRLRWLLLVNYELLASSHCHQLWKAVYASWHKYIKLFTAIYSKMRLNEQHRIGNEANVFQSIYSPLQTYNFKTGKNCENDKKYFDVWTFSGSDVLEVIVTFQR